MSPGETVAVVDQCARDDEIDQLLVELLRLPSPQTERLETDPELRAFVAEKVAPRIQSLTQIPPALDAMGNLVWRFGGSGTSAPGGLLLMAYAMTFPAASMSDPFSGIIHPGKAFGLEGPCAWGRGACEQKGALTAMIAAAAIVVRSRCTLEAPLFLVVSLAGETGRHDAARFILEHDRIEARHGIVGLGTCNRVCLGNKGRLDVEISIRGESCHSSTPWAGKNAIDGARQVMNLVDRLPLPRSHPHLGDSTLAITRIESSPPISHTIQDSCRLVLDRRLLPGEDPDLVFGEIRKGLSAIPPWEIEINRGAFMYPSEVAQDCPIAVATQAMCEHFGERPEPFYSAAALDAGYLNRMGMETVMLGPGDLRFAHTDQEVITLDEVRAAARIYAATALQMLG